MENPEAAGYSEYQNNPPIPHPKAQGEEEEEKKQTDPETQRVEERQASCQCHHYDRDPGNALAFGEEGSSSVCRTPAPGCLEKQGQGQCTGYDAHPEGEKAWPGAQLVMIGIFKRQEDGKDRQGDKGYTSDLPGSFHSCLLPLSVVEAAFSS